MHTQHKRACTGMAWSSLRCRLILTTRAGSSKLGSFVLVCIALGVRDSLRRKGKRSVSESGSCEGGGRGGEDGGATSPRHRVCCVLR